MVTLHEELAAILRANGNRWMSLDTLAEAVNQRGNYTKGDGSPVGPGQVHLRTRKGGKYEYLFERDGRQVRLRQGSDVRSAPNVATRPRRGSIGQSSEAIVRSAAAVLAAPRFSLAQALTAIPSVRELASR